MGKIIDAIKKHLTGQPSAKDLDFIPFEENYCTRCGTILDKQLSFDDTRNVNICEQCGQGLINPNCSDVYVWYCNKCNDIMNNQSTWMGENGKMYRCNNCGVYNDLSDSNSHLFWEEEDFKRMLNNRLANRSNSYSYNKNHRRNYNSSFLDIMESINVIAKSYGFENGRDWAKYAKKRNEISNEDFKKYLNCHYLRNQISHGNARNIYVSYETFCYAKKFEYSIRNSFLRM